MHRASRAIAALVITSASAGCYHYTADIPGVLDTRSDGSTADVSPLTVSDPELGREGLSAIFAGDGVRVEGSHVSVEDRHFFAGVTLLFPGVFLLSNESAREEMELALGDAALREVRLGHRYSGFDVLLSAIPGLVPCVPLLLAPQPYTFSASGERIAAGGRPPENRPVSPPMGQMPPPPTAPDDVDGDAPKPDTAKPDTAKPDTAKPDAAKPDAAKPDAAKPDAAKPDAAKPDAAKPDAAKPADDAAASETGGAP